MSFFFAQAVMSKLATFKAIPRIFIVLLALVSAASAAAPRFSGPGRVGLMTGDQWEPSIAADALGHVFILYPQYGKVTGCDGCQIPTMLLVASEDDGKTWQTPRVMLESKSGQFDAQIAIDPADGRTIYAAWLQDGKR